MEKKKVKVSLEYENELMEQYHEIRDFLDVSFPEWTTHNGVGTMSTELIAACRKANQYLYKDKELTKKQQLKMIYTNIIKLYGYYREEYKLVFALHCVDTFFDLQEDYYINKEYGALRKKYHNHVCSLKYNEVCGF